MLRATLLLPVGWLLVPALSSATEPIARTAVPARVTAAAVIHEVNLARQNPTFYADLLEQTRHEYSGYFCHLPDLFPLRTHEGIRAVNEAIRFLRAAKAVSPLALSPGLCLAAADHCREQATGAIGHGGSNRTNPGNRISGYGVVSQGWGENIAYGRHSARQIVMALIIDDGVRGRGHRKNIFNRTYNAAGAAYGPHAKFGSVCSIDFASGYSEPTFVRAENGPEETF
jgi:uncharacterized protein YkwD